MMSRFLSCDWGTSSFRLRLVEAETFQILSEISTNQGIASTFSQWQQSDQTQTSRTAFYLNYVQSQIGQLAQQLSAEVEDLPLIFSGMASSSIGIEELPYGRLPFSLSGKGILCQSIDATNDFPYTSYLISGIRSEKDVMRGEETQLLGAFSQLKAKDGKALYIFPGTHSKHIWIKEQRVIAFQTYMTGEFFDLLSTKSILSTSIAHHDGLISDSFIEGVEAAKEAPLLQASFWIRTQQLFGKLHKAENFDFLSGLLIGSELKELVHHAALPIYLCSGSRLSRPYRTALRQLGFDHVTVLSDQQMDQAVVCGQHIIYQQMLKQ